MRFYPLVGVQCPHRRHVRACAQNNLHLLQCQAGWLNSDSCLCQLSQHLYLTGHLTNVSDMIIYLAKVQFVLAWFALVYWKHHPSYPKQSCVAAVSCYHLGKGHVDSRVQVEPFEKRLPRAAFLPLSSCRSFCWCCWDKVKLCEWS